MRYGLLVLTAVLLAACATRETLVPGSPMVPAGTDLSGIWVLRSDSAASNRQLADAQRQAADDLNPIIQPRQSRRSKREGGMLVNVFLETGELLRITQTDYGLFISFDRAVVEEYRFGEAREASVGPIVADRVSGWQAGAYVIETLDEDGNKLHERYHLENGGALLVRQISVYKRKALQTSVVQVFNRSS